jgi:hypothetical protein
VLFESGRHSADNAQQIRNFGVDRELPRRASRMTLVFGIEKLPGVQAGAEVARMGRSSRRSADTVTLTGRTVSRYAVLEPLGEGGMGVVYKAKDTRLGRLVALKIMRPDPLRDETQRRRFPREAQAASALNHPGIVTVYEIDADAGLDYIAMEYVAGGTLAT